MPESFREALEECLAGIPRGRAATCGSVARALGDLRAARAVAVWLKEHPETPGGHRVVRVDGRPVLSFALEGLAEEGLVLRDGRVRAEDLLASLPAQRFLERLRSQQQRLAAQVSERDEAAAPRTFGGVDVSYVGDRAFSVAVCLDADALDLIDLCEREVEADFPYIPTYLAFREFPAIAASVQGLRERPDLLFVDGHGRLHPALFGLACFVGVELDMPTIGIAKHPLTGRPMPSKGDGLGAARIEIDGVPRGFAWVPPGASRAFFVSVGHRITLCSALTAAQRATRRRYPEPLVIADRKSKEKKDKKNAERSASGQAAGKRPPAQKHQGV